MEPRVGAGDAAADRRDGKMTGMRTFEAVAVALNARGVEATVEYPGFILITDWSFDRSAAIGTANGCWGGDVTEHDGHTVAALPLGLPLTTSPDEIARVIIALQACYVLIHSDDLQRAIDLARSVVASTGGGQ